MLQHEEHAHHGGNVHTYGRVFMVLAALTIAEVLVAEALGGLIGGTLLMALTFGKAGLVVAYYMHLKYDPPILTWLFVVPMIMAIAMIISMQGLAGY